MDNKQKIRFVYDCLAGKDSIPVKLRMKQAFDAELHAKLVEVLEDLVEEYEDKQEVPKALAFAFVDLRTSFDAAAGWFSEKDQERIADAAEELVDLAYQLFSKED